MHVVNAEDSNPLYAHEMYTYVIFKQVLKLKSVNMETVKKTHTLPVPVNLL